MATHTSALMKRFVRRGREECDSQCSDDISPMLEAPLPPHAALPIALVPLAKSSPERRVTQKEIIAGEERPKFLTIKQVQDSSSQDGEDGGGGGSDGSAAAQNPQRYIVETITMTTVTERRLMQKPVPGSSSGSPVPTSRTTASPSASSTIPPIVPAGNEGGSTAVPVAGGVTAAGLSSAGATQDYRLLQQQQQKQLRAGQSMEGNASQLQTAATSTTAAAAAASGTGLYETVKHKPLSTAQAISGILKGGKLWKNEQQHHQHQQQHPQQHQQQHQQQQQQQTHQQHSSVQNDDSTAVTSDEETSSKRSVRFNEESTIREACCDGEVQAGLSEGEVGTCRAINYMSDTLKRHSSGLFHNALRPNSAVRQLFPSSAIQPLLTTAISGNGPTAPTATPPGTTMVTMAGQAGAQTTTTGAGAAGSAHPTTVLTQEALKAFDDAKKTPGLVHQHSLTSNSGSMSNIPNSAAAALAVSAVAATAGGGAGIPGGPGETDTIRRTIERNALRRSLIKYEPKKKIPVKDVTSLEERIRQLTCDIDDPIDESAGGGDGSDNAGCDGELGELERRDSPAGEENPQQPKYIPDKSFSPSSSASSSSSGSNGSTYKKITDLFHRDRRQEKIPEADENPIVIIPQVSGHQGRAATTLQRPSATNAGRFEFPWQDCRCPAGPDIGMGVQIQGAHTQIHQPPQQRQVDSRRQFLSTLAPLTACVAGQRDDLSYYTLAHPGDRSSMASSQSTEYSIGDIDAALHEDDGKKVAPDVIAGTPGQESDELAAFVQQEGARTERLKKRYSAETSTSAPASGAGSDDDEQNDYGFNSRPSVRGIKPRFGSTNEILQQMQAQLAAPTPPQAKSQPATVPAQTQPIQSNTLPRPHTASSMHVAAAKQQITTHQHTASWSYYPAVDPAAQAKGVPGGPQQQQQQQNQQQQQQQQQASTAAPVIGQTAATAGQPNMLAAVDPHGNYYHIPVQTRHSYHGQEAIYQNCANLPLGVQASAVQVQSHQIHTQHHQAVHTAHHIHQLTDTATATYGKFARSPTRRPESPPPLRNYHQTMVLIPYNAETYHRYTAQEQENYRRQHNIVEYQQVTQQTIRVPVGYPLPGMQLHVVAAGARTGLPPHYSTLPRLGTNAAPVNAATGTSGGPVGSGQSGGAPPPLPPQGKPPAYSQYPGTVDGKPGVKFTERGAPEGAASVQPSDASQLLSPTGQGHGPPGMPSSASSSATTTAGTTAVGSVAGPGGQGQGGATGVVQSGQGQGQMQQQQQQQGGAVFYAMNV
uniref:Uncharacterized protein n=1 Tax=Anopheles atroparvus TaxID=41427 RepID=A0A182JME2_ANOAO